jgi:hypothetical protein
MKRKSTEDEQSSDEGTLKCGWNGVRTSMHEIAKHDDPLEVAEDGDPRSFINVFPNWQHPLHCPQDRKQCHGKKESTACGMGSNMYCPQ